MKGMYSLSHPIFRFRKAKGIAFVAYLSIYLCICQCGPVFAPLRFCSELQ